MLGVVEKQPVEVMDYDVSFERWLVDDDAITDASAEVFPPGALAVQTLDVDPDLIKVWLTGGESGFSYKVEITFQTAGGRTGQVEFRVRVKDK
jgi:hypothetical protein